MAHYIKKFLMKFGAIQPAKAEYVPMTKRYSIHGTVAEVDAHARVLRANGYVVTCHRLDVAGDEWVISTTR